MVIDATFWVGVSFVIFFGGLIYLKIPQKINEVLTKLILDIKNEIDESEKLRSEAKVLLDKAQSKLDTAKKVSDNIIEQAKNISVNSKTCSDLSKKGKELESKQSGQVKVEDISQLPFRIRNIVKTLKLSKASKPIKMNSGFLIIMVCKRIGGEIVKNMRAQIKNILLQRRAVLTDRRMLRDIRRTAFLDIRQ